jgi:phosphonate transport system substrate-binding protein
MWRSFAGVFFGMALFVPSAFGGEPPLTFGLFPYLTPQKLATGQVPLRDHLQQVGGRALTLATAPSNALFLERMRAGEYDLIFAAPHFARMAERDHGFRRVAMTRYRVHGYVIVPAESPVRSLADLRGKRVAMPPRDAMVHLLALESLRAAGLEPGRDVTLREYDSNENALAAPVRGDAEAGATGHLVWQKSGLRERTRSVAHTASVPGFMLMAHPRVPAALVEKWRAAAIGFGATPQGKDSLAASGHQAWLPIDDAAMGSLDRYLRHLPN